MSTQNPIPHGSRFIATSNVFSAAFGTPVAGMYSFDVAANTRQVVLPLSTNTVYLIDKISVSGSIGEENYFASLSTLPTATFGLLITKENVYPRPIPIVQYFDGMESACFVQTNKGGESLVLTVNGVLKQIAATVGVDPISINISCGIYAIDEMAYNAAFRDVTSPEFAKRALRR